MPNDTALREALRRNVGHWPTTDPHHPPAAVAPPTVFKPSRVYRPPGAPAPPGAPGAPGAGENGVTLGAAEASLGIDNPGRPICIAMSALTGVRTVLVSDRLSFPYLIRKLTFSGNNVAASAFSWRVLVSQDNDTTALQNPSGSDIIVFNSQVLGAEDVGIHGILSFGPLTFEPWTRVIDQGTFLKLKVHNVSGGTLVITLWADLDQLVLS